VNLTPAIGEVNADSSNLPYSEIIGENRAYGQYNFEYDKVNKTVESGVSIRGDIARIQLYLKDKYGQVLGLKFSAEKNAINVFVKFKVVETI